MRIGVVGAGIIGLAVARRLGELRPDAEITVVEKEDGVARHQTGRNSGVVHAGIYYAPGSLKARLCRRGGELLREYCAEKGIPLRECGKLVVALDETQIERLRELERRGTANGVPGLRWLEGDELREVEPNAAG
ncbi:MAG: FAD-dependent oxidoreductase, partial [Actinobacteria bacterium]|nr:FAD-dependent oxidoreductase [Actinomycetota bacterium]